MDPTTIDTAALGTAVVGVLALVTGFELAVAAIERLVNGRGSDGGVE